MSGQEQENQNKEQLPILPSPEGPLRTSRTLSMWFTATRQHCEASTLKISLSKPSGNRFCAASPKMTSGTPSPSGSAGGICVWRGTEDTWRSRKRKIENWTSFSDVISGAPQNLKQPRIFILAVYRVFNLLS